MNNETFENINFIFCNDPLQPKKVDMDYEEEYNEAIKNNRCSLFSYESLQDGVLKTYGDTIQGLTIYRGWMMEPNQYKLFYNLLKDKNIILINSPENYKKYHTLPGWYKDFKDNTIESFYTANKNIDEALSLVKDLKGPFIVKDYVKSRKHEWFDACYIDDISNINEAKRIISNFVDRQDDNFVGGIVLRRFEKLKSIGYHEKSNMPISEEYRIFVFNKKILILDDYWRNDSSIYFSNDELLWINSLIDKIDSAFVTIDIARKENGQLVIIELGDGQVSGLQQIAPNIFYKKINSF